jgi:hypothetical protein
VDNGQLLQELAVYCSLFALHCLLKMRIMKKPIFSGDISFYTEVLDKAKRSSYMPTLDAIVMNMLDEDMGPRLKNFLSIQGLQFQCYEENMRDCSDR